MEVIAIFGVPRSGTSWLGQLFNSHPGVAYRYQPLFSYAFKDRLRSDSNRQEIIQFYDELLHTKDDFVLQRKSVSGKDLGLDFRKEPPTHLVWKEVRYLHLMEQILRESDTRIIGIVRHPCAVLNSWRKAPKEFDPSWNFQTEWRTASQKNQGRPEEFYGYYKWKEAAHEMLRLESAFSGRMKLVVYEQLNAQPLSETEKLFQFCGMELPEQTKTFVAKSSSTESDDPYGVFRKNQSSHNWIGELPEAIVQEVLSDPAYQKLANRFGW